MRRPKAGRKEECVGLSGGQALQIRGIRAVASLRSLARFGLFVAAFYFAYIYGMGFSQATASPFWFPDSVLLCALLSTRRRSWPYLLVATVPIRLLAPAASDTPVWF